MESIRAAVVEAGIVVNVIVVDSLDQQVAGGILVECPSSLEGVGIGSTYNEATGEFSITPELEEATSKRLAMEEEFARMAAEQREGSSS
jgi:hypothetical protein